MKERVIREEDKKVYQPAIHSDRINELYFVRKITGLPMTVMVDEAIKMYIAHFIGTPEWKAVVEHEFRQEDDYMEQQEEKEQRDVDECEDGTMYGF